jgi:hypothetical protein
MGNVGTEQSGKRSREHDFDIEERSEDRSEETSAESSEDSSADNSSDSFKSKYGGNTYIVFPPDAEHPKQRVFSLF